MSTQTEDHLDHVGLSDQLGAARQEIEQLRRGLEAHAAVDQAKGVLMALHGMDAEQAWELLTRVSSESNVRVRRLAESLTALAGGTGIVDVEAARTVVVHLLRPAAGDRVAADFVARMIGRTSH